MPVVLPITTGGGFAWTAGFAVSLVGTGMQTTGIVRCDQQGALDVAARGGGKPESAPASIVDEALARLTTIFD